METASMIPCRRWRIFILEPDLEKRPNDYHLDSSEKLTSRLKYVGNDRNPQTMSLAKI